MNIATIEVSSVYASAKGYTHIPAGIVGATVKFDFRDDAWAGLNKTAVFRGCVTLDVLITEDEVRIPSETVERAGLTLKVGVYGTDSDNNIIIPTLWADVGTIRDSTDPSGDPGTDPSLPIWAQLYDEVEKLKQNTPDYPDVPSQDGEDGFSPIATVTQTDSGAVISITDKDGTTTATITNGKDGTDGKSAYWYATEAGYTGTEEDFATKLADETPAVDPKQVNALIDTKLYSVTTYGAKGDGVTDDTAAFKNALANNRIVTVPGGTYVLSGTLVIRENCCLELSQDTVLQFSQTSGNCIEMRGSATLRGNHAIISVPYEMTGNAISIDTALDGEPHNSIPPYAKADPMFKRQRFIYDVNIVKPNAAGFYRSNDGKCNGTAIYLSAEGTASIRWMWAITMSGIRIGGGFSYGIRAANFDKPGDYTDNAWNHDMRIEAVIEACEVGVSLENCNGAHLAVTVQPCVAENTAKTKYAKWGVYLNDSRYVDMIGSRVWDWKGTSLWTSGGQYQHIAMVGNCRGLLLDDFLCSEESEDIRDLIYTDTPANFDTMSVLQEPGNKWFKSKDGKPYFFDGTSDKQLMMKTEKFSAEQAEFIHPADGYYTYDPKFTDLAGNCQNGYYIGSDGSLVSDGDGQYTTTDFIPIDGANVHTYRIGGEGITWNDSYGQCRIAWYDANKAVKGSAMSWDKIGLNQYYPQPVEDDTVAAAFVTSANNAGPKGAAYFRITAKGSGTDLIVTIDEAQEYNAVWHGEPKRLDESIYAQKTMIASPSGKIFVLTVADDGKLSAAEFTE